MRTVGCRWSDRWLPMTNQRFLLSGDRWLPHREKRPTNQRKSDFGKERWSVRWSDPLSGPEPYRLGSGPRPVEFVGGDGPDPYHSEGWRSSVAPRLGAEDPMIENVAADLRFHHRRYGLRGTRNPPNVDKKRTVTPYPARRRFTAKKRGTR